MALQSVGILGYGAFGALVHTLLKRFAPQLEVRIYDAKKKGAKFSTLASVAASDILILAVPIREFEIALSKILPLTKKSTVLVDVTTVKVHTLTLLKRMAGDRLYISTHPVWGPESYEKKGGDVTGFRIVVADHTLPKLEYQIIRNFITHLGFDVVEVGAEEHDKHIAETLFLTHFIGQTVSRAGFVRTDMDTVSFGYLMDAVESVKKDEALFRDVFSFNPYCRSILDRLAEAERAVRSLLEAKQGAKGIRVGVSGAKGSFSEEAARTYAKKTGLKKYSVEYLISVEGVLSALENGAIDLGVFPIENSTGGVVTEAVEAMAKHNFRIRKMFDIDIRQNLLIQKGASEKKITTIASHEQALRQCKATLKRKWPKAKLKDYEDTAKAAEDLARGTLPGTTAVIASKTAAEVYGLKVLEAGIQDQKSNATTFIAAER